MAIKISNRNAPNGTSRFAASHLELFLLGLLYEFRFRENDKRGCRFLVSGFTNIIKMHLDNNYLR